MEIYYNGGWYSMLEQFGGMQGAQSGSKIYDISPFISGRHRGAGAHRHRFRRLRRVRLRRQPEDHRHHRRAAAAAVNRTVRDEFNTVSYDNNDGPDDWLLWWMEEDEQSGGDGPGTGQVRITGGELRLDDHPNTGGYAQRHPPGRSGAGHRRAAQLRLPHLLGCRHQRRHRGGDLERRASTAPCVRRNDWDYDADRVDQRHQGRDHRLADLQHLAPHHQLRPRALPGGQVLRRLERVLLRRQRRGARQLPAPGWCATSSTRSSYGNDDGTDSWSTNWSEIGESDGPWGG